METMTKLERTNYLIGLTDAVQRQVPFGLTRGDVDRLVALARVSGTSSLMAEVLRPGWDDKVWAPERAALWITACSVRDAVRQFDREHPEGLPDLEARVEAAQTALSDLQPERL